MLLVTWRMFKTSFKHWLLIENVWYEFVCFFKMLSCLKLNKYIWYYCSIVLFKNSKNYNYIKYQNFLFKYLKKMNLITFCYWTSVKQTKGNITVKLLISECFDFDISSNLLVFADAQAYCENDGKTLLQQALKSKWNVYHEWEVVLTI